MRRTDKFSLFKNGVKIGDVVWHREVYYKNGKRTFDASFEAEPEVLARLHAALEKAVKEKATYTVLPWTNIPEEITHPQYSADELAAALAYAGFDPLPEDSEVMQQISGGGHFEGLCY